MEAVVEGELLEAPAPGLSRWRAAVFEIGPAMLEAVAAFAYGFEIIEEAMAAHRAARGGQEGEENLLL